ncbi:ankyrin repeat-containing protein [Anaeramoeba flamelloides]|uniref:Ankyrin repeat-containing protein n=1 Tax=Anaeramoeba flamelloides TaxID=1746091 RepID=A0AAV7YZU4_9EUKA|nr:ankyrin repeat-containing protein [Anaeramoeba flamelloides]
MTEEETIKHLISIIPKITKEQAWYCLKKHKQNLEDAIFFALENEIQIPSIKDPNCTYEGNDEKSKIIPQTQNEKEKSNINENEKDNENEKEKENENKIKKDNEKENNNKKVFLNGDEIDEMKEMDIRDIESDDYENVLNESESGGRLMGSEGSEEKQNLLYRDEGKIDLNEIEKQKGEEILFGYQGSVLMNNRHQQDQEQNLDELINHTYHTGGEKSHDNELDNEQQIEIGNFNHDEQFLSFLRENEFDEAAQYLEYIKNDKGSKIKRKWLHSAIKYGANEIIKILVENGVDINYTNPRRKHPVFVAIKHNQVECLKTILQLGANPNGNTNSYEFPIEKALENNNHLIIKILLQYGSTTRVFNDQYILIRSTKKGEVADIQTLLKAGIDPKIKGKRGVNAFLVSRSIYMKDIIKKETKINFLNIYQNIEQKKKEELSNWILLLKDKKYSELNNENIEKLFELALSNEFKKEIKTLVDSNFEINKLCDSSNNYLVHLCVYYSNYWLAKLLVSLGVDLELVGAGHKTPLQLASEYNNVLIFTLYYIHSKNIVLTDFEMSQNQHIITKILYEELKALKRKYPSNINLIYQDYKKFIHQNQLISKWVDLNADLQFLDKIDENTRYVKHLIKYKDRSCINIRFLDYNFKSKFSDRYFSMIANSNKPFIKQLIDPVLGYYISCEADIWEEVNIITGCHSLPTIRVIIQKFLKNKISIDPILILSIAKQIINTLLILKREFNFFHLGLNSSSVQLVNNGKIKIIDIFTKAKFSYYNISDFTSSDENYEKNNLYSFGIILWELFMCTTYDIFINKKDDIHIFDHKHEIPDKMLDSLRKKKLTNSMLKENSEIKKLIYNNLRDIVYECLSLGKYQLSLFIEEIYNKIERCYTIIDDQKIVIQAEREFLNKINELKIEGNLPVQSKQEKSVNNDNHLNLEIKTTVRDSIDYTTIQTIEKLNLKSFNTIHQFEVLVWEMFIILKNIAIQDKSLDGKYQFIKNIFEKNGWLETKFASQDINKEQIINLLERGISDLK